MDLRTDSAREELIVLTKLSLPVISTNLLAYLLQVVGQIFLGRLGASSLAAAALGNSYFNMVWYFIQGVSTALDTLASQSFGKGDTEGVRLWSQRAALVHEGRLPAERRVPGHRRVLRHVLEIDRKGVGGRVVAEVHREDGLRH